MPKSKAAQRPTKPGRGGLGSVWGGHPGDGLGSQGNCKTKQQPGFCSSTEDVPKSRRSGLPPSTQQYFFLERVMMSALAKEKMFLALKKRGSVCSPSNHESQQKEGRWRSKHSISTVSHVDEPSPRDEASRLTVRMENTYQLGPTRHFPVAAVNRILKDVLTAYLQEAEYDPEFCRQMTKTVSEVIKAKVKELMIPWYKLIVTVYIGQQDGQGILIGSRCLWNPKSDTVSSYALRNSTLFALANVYAVYFE